MSVAEVLAEAVARLRETSDTAQLDAEVLLAHCLRQNRAWLRAHDDAGVAPAVLEGFRALVARRGAGVPVAYLTGQREFWSLTLEVTPAVLIPRPETETLVQATLERLPAHACRIADLGTGSGAIALALARERPDCAVVATDSSDAALRVARNNAERHGLQRVDFRLGAWFAPLANERFDAVASNPPYVAPDDPHLAALLYEPRRALVAGEHGLADLRRIIEQAPAHLHEGGWLLLEHGAAQDGAVRELMARAGFAGIGTLSDLAGLPRVTLGQRP